LNRFFFVIALVVLSSLSIALQVQPDVLAVLVSSTTTQTSTSNITLTGTGQTTHYVTFKEVSSVQTLTETTYTTKGDTKVPVQVLTTTMSPVVVTTHTAVVTVISGHTIGAARAITVTYYVPKTGYVLGYSQATVYGTVTSQYVTNVPTTIFSTSASTITYATGQVVSVTGTQTLTSVSEQAGPSISDMFTRNWWILLVVGAGVLVVLAFTLGRRAAPPKSPPSHTERGDA
jgi:hypothetical protein